MRITIMFGVALTWTGALMGQDSARATLPRTAAAESAFRDPTTARVLGTVVPGAGHVYATEYRRGAALYFGTVSTIGLGALSYVIDACTFTFTTQCDPGPQWPHRTVGVIAIGAGVGMWIYSSIDAPRAARRANERHRRRKASIAPLVEPRRGARGGVNAGIGIQW